MYALRRGNGSINIAQLLPSPPFGPAQRLSIEQCWRRPRHDEASRRVDGKRQGDYSVDPAANHRLADGHDACHTLPTAIHHTGLSTRLR